MQPYSNSRLEWPAVLACLAVFAIAVLALTSCSLDTSVVGHRTDEPVTVVHGAAAGARADDTDAGLHLHGESILCSVAQMQTWVVNNYPYAYGWTDTFTGNNGKARLTVNSCSYYERQWIAFTGSNCTATHCEFDMKNCDGSCAIGGCAHYRYLDCYCGDLNGCQVSP